ncbi:iron-containing alcohol dehydrogenase [Rhodopseudomonas sp. HC1]|uniref:iron-containing alcohol dehydrogenase n=1 Tax=Rhodopseudomonas infernalis TaxID=2897386 RepID=UPI001EE8EEC9|nr:iron-containing alcohol dehydrogenase [Rhodopseudomonas infernalis]MCG6207911.1 iron-containing alcohol dehydrogenase [Rhodopseudomonas infernalis]
MISPFSIARLPRIQFGAGAIARLPDLAARYGRRVLLVTGARSFDAASYAAALLAKLAERGLSCERVTVSGEPSPELVDAAVRDWHGANIDVVIGIGGGSALDAAKAIAGLLRPGNSVMDHLEGVGPELPYKGPATPFIALPTTAGTGSEATKNAVLSRHGPDGFKKSFRDESLVAEIALVDPDLLAGCPPALIAANGMDALTQLLESYVSTGANDFTDALALSGLRAASKGLLAWYQGGGDATDAMAQMAYASLQSGICLAQTGLGSVHGLASPLGAYFPIGHGVVCGTLLAAATRVNIEALSARTPQSAALAKYAEIGRLLSGRDGASAEEDCDNLVATLEDWTQRLALPSLSSLGIAAGDVDRIVATSRGSSMKTNPIVLTDDEIRAIVTARM